MENWINLSMARAFIKLYEKEKNPHKKILTGKSYKQEFEKLNLLITLFEIQGTQEPLLKVNNQLKALRFFIRIQENISKYEQIKHIEKRLTEI